MLDDLGITGGQVARYSLMPQIFPRVKKILANPFINLPYFIVVVFNTMNILPDDHPYLRREYRGQYSLVKALAAAANYITVSRNNIDKITIFTVILSGIALFFLQLVLCVFALFTTVANAADMPTTIGGFFDNANTKTDIAFRMLDMVFGIPKIFKSDVQTNTPFHQGLHALFEFYSFGILLVGTFIIIYLVTRIVLETAQSGVPFGKRFSHAWVPVRLILFFGLLLPMGTSGINLAQYTLLNAARLGSNLATNAWLTFDRTTRTPYVATATQLIATPSTPSLNSFTTFMALARVCSWAEGRHEGFNIRPYAVFNANINDSYSVFSTGPGNVVELTSSMAVTSLMEKMENGAITIRFGEKDATKYPGQTGGVFPYCGELSLPIIDQAQPGSAYMQQAYLGLIMCLWSGEASRAMGCEVTNFSNMGRDYTARYARATGDESPMPDMSPYTGQSQKTTILTLLNEELTKSIQEAAKEQTSKGNWSNDPALVMGWGGAGIWFNRIAEQNGSLTGAVHAIPEIRKLPHVMQIAQQQKLEANPSTRIEDMFTVEISNGRKVQFERPAQESVLVILSNVARHWGSDRAISYDRNNPITEERGMSGNIIIDTINMMMGTQGLIDMCKNTDIHPLAQLSSLGKGLIDHSIRSFGIAAGLGLAGGLLTLLDQPSLGQSLVAATSFFTTFATIGLMLGFILYYVLPFLPFIYFFFAVGTWVKSIFEAMVGMPLWALAHLRIDGEGMPGEAAAGGYFYILEIFLRPIIIIISFLGGILIFAAMVKVLNSIFYLVLSNLSGHSNAAPASNCFQPPSTAGTTGAAGAATEETFRRGTLDEFFYTVVYAIIVYMIGLPCFKLVDLIPDKIMRWFTSGLETFGANDGDPAENLMRNVTFGASALGGGLKQVGGSFGLR